MSLATASRLVSIVGILMMMSLFLLLGKFLPVVLDIVILMLPLVPDYLGYLGI